MEDGPAGRRRFRLVMIAAAVLLLVGMRAALPTIARRVIEPQLAELLSLRVEIGDVDLRLIEGELALEDTVLCTRAGNAELFRAHRIALDVDWGALLASSLEAELLSVEEPQLIVAYDREGRLNWADVGPAPRPAPVGGEKPAAPFRVAIAKVELGSGVLRLVDEEEGGLPSMRLALGAFALDGLEVVRPEPGAPIGWGLAGARAADAVIGLAPEGGEATELALRAEVGPELPGGRHPLALELSREGGVRFEARGELVPDPLQLSAKLTWQGLQSRAVLPLLAVQDVRVERGRSNGALEAALSLVDGPERGLRMSGTAAHDDLVLEAEFDTRLRLTLKHIEGDLAELRVPMPARPSEPPEPRVVHWSRMEVQEPQLDVTLAEGAGGAEPPTPGGAEPAGVQVKVDALALHGGVVRLHDPALGPEHEQAFSDITLDATGLRWPPVAWDAGTLVAGSLGEQPLRVGGKWSPDAADLEFTAHRVPLSSWNPEITHYSDYSIASGELSLDGTLRRRGDACDAPFTVVLHQLQARSRGDAFQQTFGMPLSAATALLRDPAGNIQLSARLRGAGAECTRVDLLPLVGTALREAVFNALASTLSMPVDAIGGVLRRVGELAQLGVGEAVFPPGRATLRSDTQLVLASTGELVRRTPRSRLVLVPEVVSDDLLALGIEKKKGFLGELVDVGRRLLTRSELASPARARLEALVQSRLDAVEAALRDQVSLPPARIERQSWDGEVREGPPRILLRVDLAPN